MLSYIFYCWMSDVKICNIIGVDTLNTDSERFSRMKCEGH
jgi:hypothetical protein